MVGIIGIIAFLTVLGLSMLITKIATVALVMTGMSPHVARFQARSAFTGTGFTTVEAEEIVNHPVRRRLIVYLMIVRSAGLVTIILSLVLSMAGTNDLGKVMRLAWLSGGVLFLWLLSHSRRINWAMGRVIHGALSRWTQLDLQDYISLLHLSGDYRVTEIRVQQQDWLADKGLHECTLRDEGVSVLGITRKDGSYIGVPQGKTRIRAGDTLILYGRADDLESLSQRRADVLGDRAHQQAIQDQQHHMAEQDRQDRASDDSNEIKAGKRIDF